VSFRRALRLALGGSFPSDLPPEIESRLEALDRLLRHWAPKLDLIGFRSEEERLLRYFAEPIAAVRWLHGKGRALDIGSGGGSPGLPFAIARPGLSWTFLEPRERRRLFLEEAVRELGIENVVVSAERFGGGTGMGFAVVSSRGVRFSEADLDGIARALAAGGRFLWLSGEARLREAERWLRARPGLSVEGPRLLLQGAEARILVVTQGTGECFT
jgi:16S rRNA (guanine527-N7)-methyltransferase